MSEAIRNLFTRISPTYDRLNHLLSFNIDKTWRRKALSLTLADRDTPLQILDVCAGTLDFSIEAARLFPQSTITSADFSEGMLTSGKRKLLDLGVTHPITTVCADALDLPFDDGTFDLVLCAYGLRNLDDKNAGLSEMKRVLRPGGQLLVLEFFRPQTLTARLFNKTYSEFVLPLVGGWISGDKTAYAYLRDSVRSFMSTNECLQMLSAMGFENAQSKDFLFSISTAVTAIKPK